VKDAKVSKDELMKDDDLPAGYGDDEAAEPAKKPAKKTAAKKTAAKKAD
jgi:hypothetical protein